MSGVSRVSLANTAVGWNSFFVSATKRYKDIPTGTLYVLPLKLRDAVAHPQSVWSLFGLDLVDLAHQIRKHSLPHPLLAKTDHRA